MSLTDRKTCLFFPLFQLIQHNSLFNIVNPVQSEVGTAPCCLFSVTPVGYIGRSKNDTKIVGVGEVSGGGLL